MDPVDAEIAKTQEERKIMEAALAPNSITFDTELYDGSNRFQDYNREIPANDDEENADAMDNEVARKLASYTAPRSLLNDMPRGGDDDESLGFKKSQRIIDREDDYRRRRLNQVISPERHDAFANGDKTPKPETRTYADIMREAALKREKEETLKVIARRKKEEEENKAAGKEREREPAASQPSQKRRNRWDQNQDNSDAKKAKSGSDWDMPDSTPGIGRWDATPTPGRIGDATPSLSRKTDGMKLLHLVVWLIPMLPLLVGPLQGPLQLEWHGMLLQSSLALLPLHQNAKDQDGMKLQPPWEVLHLAVLHPQPPTHLA